MIYSVIRTVKEIYYVVDKIWRERASDNYVISFLIEIRARLIQSTLREIYFITLQGHNISPKFCSANFTPKIPPTDFLFPLIRNISSSFSSRICRIHWPRHWNVKTKFGFVLMFGIK